MRRALLLALLTSTALAAAAPETGDLPPIACVEALRNARLAQEQNETPKARAQYEAAAALPGCDLPALSGLLRLLRETGASGDAVAGLRARLAARLSDPTVELPAGFLKQLEILGATAKDRDGDRLLLDALRRREAAAAAARRELARAAQVEILEVRAALEERLDEGEAARETLGRLLAVPPSDAVRWRAVLFDMAKQRWQSAADLLAGMVAEKEAPEVLRYFYVTSLAHLGRYDEMLRQLDGLAPPPAPGAPPPGQPPAEAERMGPGLGPVGFVSLVLESAWALRDAGRDAEAAALFRRALVYDPQQPEAQAALLHLYGTAEEKAAAAAATASRQQAETDPVKLFEEGSDLLGAGDAAGALAMLARAAPVLGGTAYAEPAWYNLGAAAYKLEHWDDAARAFEQASAVNPARVESHFKRGVALFRLSRCREAVPLLRHVLELQPDKRDAHHYLAGCYTALGDTAAAARENELFAKPR